MKNIIVVGSGFGGLLTVNTLANYLRDYVRSGVVRIVLVSDSIFHYRQASFKYVVFDYVDFDSICREVSKIVQPEVEIVYSRALKVDSKNQVVYLSNGKVLNYDYLILSPGCKINPNETPGLNRIGFWYYDFENSLRLRSVLKGFKKGRIVHCVASYPFKCLSTPINFIFMLHEYLMSKGVRNNVEIVFTYPFKSPIGFEYLSKIVNECFQELNIEFIPEYLLDYVDVDKKEIIGLSGERIKFDLLITIPHHIGSELIKRSSFGDPLGWAGVDKNKLCIRGIENVYAIGDIIGLPVDKSCTSIIKQVEVVTSRITSEFLKISIDVKYDGYSCICIMTPKGYYCAERTFTTSEKPVTNVLKLENYVFTTLSETYWKFLKKGLTLSKIEQYLQKS